MIPRSAAPAASVEIPDELTRQQARDLVARLSDAEVRELIIAELDKRAVASSGLIIATDKKSLTCLAMLIERSTHPWLLLLI